MKKKRKRKPIVYTRFCRMEGCGRGIITRNRSGICTQCWQTKSEDVTAILDAEGFYNQGPTLPSENKSANGQLFITNPHFPPPATHDPLV